MVPQSRGGFDERVRDAENREQQKDKTRSDGGGKGGKGGGGGRRGRRNPSSKKNPPFDATGFLEGLDHTGNAKEALKSWLVTYFNDKLKAELKKGNRKEYVVYIEYRELSFTAFTNVVGAFDRAYTANQPIVNIANQMNTLGYNGTFQIKEDVGGGYANQIVGYEFQFSPQRKNPAPGRKGRKSGTLSLGRGKQYHIEILPRTQLNVKTKGAPGVDKKTGKSRPKGKSTVKSQGETGAERKAGITDAFGSYMHTGIDKKTGKKVPYVIKIPSKDFRAVNVEVEGKTIRTLMPMRKTSKAQQQAWAKFLSVYGYPKLANTKGDPVRFKIHKPTRGTFYRQLAKDRKKVGA